MGMKELITNNDGRLSTTAFIVSMQWIYQIVKKIKKEEIARRQFDMFGNS